MWVLIFSTNLSERLLILRRIQRDVIMNVHRYSCKVAVIPDRYGRNSNLLDRFSKNSQTSHFIKFRPIGADLFHASGRTEGYTEETTKLTVAFRICANAPNNTTNYYYYYYY
jgi:hypothetical protein